MNNKKTLVLSADRIRQSMSNLFAYLEGPMYKDDNAGLEYVCQQLERKGIESKNLIVSFDSEGYWTSIALPYYGWVIVICEEMYAVEIATGRKVPFSECL